ncbi:LysR substrate-binding domain-containing protein [Flavimaricola marinus]|uniref:HTH-type transcriptional regulator GbpR n=1 Tax=Flavimaricola marinus TaxID=1819565 RepID=A0A238LBA1_9RHOB|nr:LysR substrate-binding domain-containing protein [Flavimaricola marinus]SMY06685.1 HTH-type transcriptional regulator GbpR [Flavimaricola marinus]
MADTFLRRGLKLRHLRIVAALSETGQIGSAAEALSISQPAASRLLAEAERITGHKVHTRSGRGVVLTAQGKALAVRAARILTELDDASRDMDEIETGATGHVRLGSVTGPALDRVLPALQSAWQSLPGVTTEVEVAASDALGDMLLAGRLDFALARQPLHLDADRFVFRGMADEQVSLVVRQGHPLLQGAMPPAEALMGFDWVMPGPGAILRTAVLTRLTALGLPHPASRLATSSFLLTLTMLRQSDAIAPLASPVAQSFAGEAGSDFAVLPIDLGIRVEPYGLLTRSGSTLTPVAARLAALITGI